MCMWARTWTGYLWENSLETEIASGVGPWEVRGRNEGQFMPHAFELLLVFFLKCTLIFKLFLRYIFEHF